MWQQYRARTGLVVVLLSVMVALGIFLFAQEPPPSEGGYGGTGQHCICKPPDPPPPPAWIRITQVRLTPRKKIYLEWEPSGNAYIVYRGLLSDSPRPCSHGALYPVSSLTPISPTSPDQRITTTSFVDSFDFPYDRPIFYAVQAFRKSVVTCEGRQPSCQIGQERVFWSEGSPLTFCYVVIDKVPVADHASVDSRLDFRKNPVTFRNYRFGYSTYRGGLFVGFADDPSRIARIYLKFPFPSPPFEPDDQIWDASLLMFYTEPHESSVDIPSDPTQPHPINLKVYLASSNDWGQRSIHWSNKPSISDPAFLLFEGFAYPGSWVEIHDGKNPENYSETRRFKDIVANNVTFTYVLTMPDDNPNYCLLPDPTEKITMQKRWKYFAKREFKERWAPYVLRSTGKQVPTEQVCTQH